MASTFKTKKLGLSLWSATDRPERLDFRGDNEILEKQLGGHLDDVTRHLTAADREGLNRRLVILRYTGTGADRRSAYVGYPYDLAVVLAQGQMPFERREDGKVHYYAGCYSHDGLTPRSGGGVTMEGSSVVTTNETAEDRVYHLNESGVTYTLLLFSRAK